MIRMLLIISVSVLFVQSYHYCFVNLNISKRWEPKVDKALYQILFPKVSIA